MKSDHESVIADFALNKCLDELEVVLLEAGGVVGGMQLGELEVLLQPIFAKVTLKQQCLVQCFA